MKKFFKNRIDPLVPLWAIPPIVSCFVVNCLVYWVTMALCADLTHYDLTLDFDRAVPLLTWWIYIYFIYCYPFWAFGYCYVAHVYRKEPEMVFRFVIADILSRLTCMVFFIVMPTTTVRPEITGSALSDILTGFLYSIDQPVNLFPSIHCLVSWMCFIGTRASKQVSVRMKVFICVSAILISLSTQFIKQHYIVDLISGIALGEICYFIVGHTSLPRIVCNWYLSVVQHFAPEAKLE